MNVKKYLVPLKMTASSLILFFALCAFAACGTAPKEHVEKYPLLVEIVGDSTGVDDVRLTAVLEKYGLDETSVYGWGNRRLIYDAPENVADFQREIAGEFPTAEMKVYESPYYIFDRSNCDSGQTEEVWDRKIWSVALVADPAMQQEYMDYHQHQFEQFPEVSAGFCRAEFQQLIMYRNGRQLLLIISYPAGKDYDTLNARTVENNPRVDEWNAMMARYQTGIEGTAPDEVWISFEPVF